MNQIENNIFKKDIDIRVVAKTVAILSGIEVISVAVINDEPADINESAVLVDENTRAITINRYQCNDTSIRLLIAHGIASLEHEAFTTAHTEIKMMILRNLEPVIERYIASDR